MVSHVPCGELLDAEDKHSINLPFLVFFSFFFLFLFSLQCIEQIKMKTWNLGFYFKMFHANFILLTLGKPFPVLASAALTHMSCALSS